ncbi:biotin transporter BioY [Nocardioides mesophilus]|uniref:Biotin transporter n=1 Tax=Nocardioides mesophilus TaxID=433659 RepID=A0A7G9RBA7_9ACTN|nr:biotin transporter BioY [Nocardioides mesophilus]QNN52882.1 biotin transporter BioY [Nocardioides mesophilus]
MPRSSSRDLALVAVFAGIVAALGAVPAFTPPGFSVPITAQSLGVMLAGSVIGARRGASALLLFLALVAAGLPLLSGGRGGLGVFAGSSVGFLVGFPVAAFVIGWLTTRLGAPYTLVGGLVANLVGGLVLLYVFGAAGLALVLQISPAAAATALWIYLPGDLVKVVVAAFVARGVHAAYPGLLEGRTRERQDAPVA